VLISLTVQTCCEGGVNYEEAPISYSTTRPENPISRLQDRITSGDASLAWTAGHGYLPALLQALDIPISSQVLTFSKTSLQDERIGPATPRAIYFNDDVHVGFVQNGVLEIAAADPLLGMVFYTLEQDASRSVQFQRRTNNCLTCHGAARTRNVPGLLVRSVFPDPEGQPVIAAGSRVTTPASPLAERWGGWYVTGTHGNQSHLGNYILTERRKPKQIDNAAGHNVRDLSGLCDISPYLSPHSDLVALLVLEHQTYAYNILTQAGFEVRFAEFQKERATEPTRDQAEQEWKKAVNRGADSIAGALLFANEVRLTEPVAGTSEFASEFASRGPRSPAGRSLREFDLTTRMFRFPCSYLVHSSTFRSLPASLRAAVAERIARSLADSAEVSTDGSALRDWILEEVSARP